MIVTTAEERERLMALFTPPTLDHGPLGDAFQVEVAAKVLLGEVPRESIDLMVALRDELARAPRDAEPVASLICEHDRNANETHVRVYAVYRPLKLKPGERLNVYATPPESEAPAWGWTRTFEVYAPADADAGLHGLSETVEVRVGTAPTDDGLGEYEDGTPYTLEEAIRRTLAEFFDATVRPASPTEPETEVGRDG